MGHRNRKKEHQYLQSWIGGRMFHEEKRVKVNTYFKNKFS
jgi:hypothetical protein